MHRKGSMLPVFAVIVFWGLATSSVSAAPIFFGPTPYLSAADIPAGFYAGGPTALEDFEDSALSFGIIASGGSACLCGGITDSVDGDDGAIDGSGADPAHSWFVASGATGVTFTLPGLPTAAGIVWTDGAGTTTFEAFGPGLISLGTIGPVAIADGSISGTTAEDRFFGVQDPLGIVAIKLSNTSGGIEVDHVQFGTAADGAGPVVPEPATFLLVASGLAAAAGRRYRAVRRHR